MYRREKELLETELASVKEEMIYNIRHKLDKFKKHLKEEEEMNRSSMEAGKHLQGLVEEEWLI